MKSKWGRRGMGKEGGGGGRKVKRGCKGEMSK